jgi:hypothetical protein
MTLTLKGLCHEIVDPRFFHQTFPLKGPYLGAKAVLNMALNSHRNSRKLFEMIGFHGLNVTTAAASAVSMTLRKQIPQFQ